jgi:hypothetical protein
MHNKLIIVLIGLILLLGGGMAGAVEKQDKKVSNKSAVSSGGYWKMTTPSDAPGKDPICRDFEKVLNTTKEPPENLKCNWTLPPGEKRFKKVEWQPLDWRKYQDLIHDGFVSPLNKEAGELSWKKNGPSIIKEYEEGKRSLWVTQVDIDKDGKIDHIVREEIADCPDTGRILGPMIPETGRLDFKNESLYYHFSLSADASEIIFYYGQPFIFTYRDVPNPGMVRIYRYYRYEQCRYFYQK